MYKRMTIKDLKEKIKNLPDNAILCCQSDSEGNETSVCLDIFVEQVGRQTEYQGYKFTEGDNIVGVDLQQDKDNIVVIFQPSL